MSEPCENIDDDNYVLESMIFAARNYVAPSDDLRPRTMESAREINLQKKEVRRMGLALLAGCFVWGIGIGMASSAGLYRDKFVAPSGEELSRLAIQLASNSNSNFDWGLVEAFARMRGMRIHGIDSMQ